MCPHVAALCGDWTLTDHEILCIDSQLRDMLIGNFATWQCARNTQAQTRACHEHIEFISGGCRVSAVGIVWRVRMRNPD